MATQTNVFVLRETPPELGKIAGTHEEATVQIRVFLLKRRKYIRRHKDGEVKIPTIDKLMEENIEPTSYADA